MTRKFRTLFWDTNSSAGNLNGDRSLLRESDDHELCHIEGGWQLLFLFERVLHSDLELPNLGKDLPLPGLREMIARLFAVQCPHPSRETRWRNAAEGFPPI
jgi:hypothetical protein